MLTRKARICEELIGFDLIESDLSSAVRPGAALEHLKFRRQIQSYTIRVSVSTDPQAYQIFLDSALFSV